MIKKSQILPYNSGAEVPELRPKHLASDTAKTESVLIYTLEKFGNGDEILVLLQPTSPLRTTQHINEALELFIEKQTLSVASVTPCEPPPPAVVEHASGR